MQSLYYTVILYLPLTIKTQRTLSPYICRWLCWQQPRLWFLICYVSCVHTWDKGTHFLLAPPKTTHNFDITHWFSICAMWWRRKVMKSGPSLIGPTLLRFHATTTETNWESIYSSFCVLSDRSLGRAFTLPFVFLTGGRPVVRLRSSNGSGHSRWNPLWR